ncbi:MAG: retropepsin-like aspartic protease family protein [Chromatiales bacterium]
MSELIRRTGLLLALILLAVPLPGPATGKIRVVGLFKDKAVVEIDGKQSLLNAGGPAKNGVRLISANSQQAVLEVDGERATYKLASQIGGTYAPPSDGKIVQIGPDHVGMYMANGTINGYSVRFLVDTGATMVAMNRHVARRLGINYRIDGKEGVTQTASGYTRAYYLKLKKVTIGEIALNEVEAAVLDGDQPTEVLLGNSFLGRLDMQREGKILYLKKK